MVPKRLEPAPSPSLKLVVERLSHNYVTWSFQSSLKKNGSFHGKIVKLLRILEGVVSSTLIFGLNLSMEIMWGLSWRFSFLDTCSWHQTNNVCLLGTYFELTKAFFLCTWKFFCTLSFALKLHQFEHDNPIYARSSFGLQECASKHWNLDTLYHFLEPVVMLEDNCKVLLILLLFKKMS